LKGNIPFDVHIEFQSNRGKRMQVARTSWLTWYANIDPNLMMQLSEEI
jgi:hypothetical protein